MRLPFLTAALAALSFALPAVAQKVQVFGGTGPRAASTLILFGDNLAGGMSVTHGDPAWKPEYDGMLDKVKGKLNRLGKDWWTTFTTTVDLEIGGTMVPAGAYLVGLDCSAEGKFGLAFLEATKGMKQGALPFALPPQNEMNWKPDFIAPLQLNKDASETVVEKMKIELTSDKEDRSKGTFTIAWGKHTLTGAMQLHLHQAK